LIYSDQSASIIRSEEARVEKIEGKFMTRRFGGWCAITVAVGLAAAQANAAEVFWSVATNETNSAGDVTSPGGLLAAVYVGCQQNTSDCPTPPTDDIVNGVDFGYQIGGNGTVGFNGNVDVSLSGVNAPGEFPVPSPGSEDGLVTQGDFSNLGASMTFNITGLVIGDVYSIQFFEPYWTANYNTTYTDPLSDSVTLATGCSTGCSGTPAVAQFVTGTFTADGPSEAITISNPGSYAIFGAADVFDESAPEPQTIGLVAAGLMGLAFRRWRLAQRANR
jgi:hypothetical protein